MPRARPSPAFSISPPSLLWRKRGINWTALLGEQSGHLSSFVGVQKKVGSCDVPEGIWPGPGLGSNHSSVYMPRLLLLGAALAHGSDLSAPSPDT